MTIVLIVLNLRGVKESIQILVPIFLLFLVTHVLLIGTTLVEPPHPRCPRSFVGARPRTPARRPRSSGWLPLLLIMMRAYSLGGGTYTGIEAVSNSVPVLREPRVSERASARCSTWPSRSPSRRRASSSATSWSARGRSPARTMNAVYAETVFGTWTIGGFQLGPLLVALTLVSAGALLFVAAQTGFLGGPARAGEHGHRLLGAPPLRPALRPPGHEQRDLADGLRRARDARLHARLGLAARGHVLDQRVRDVLPDAARHGPPLADQRAARRTGSATSSCTAPACSSACSILCVTVFEKFQEGGWLTVLVTASLRRPGVHGQTPLRARPGAAAPDRRDAARTFPSAPTPRSRRRSRPTSRSP